MKEIRNGREPEWSSTLQQWKGIEPDRHFADGVWNRVRAAQPAPEGRGARILRWCEGPAQAWASAAAAAGILVGVWAGFAAGNAAPPEEPLLRAGTLTGAYLDLLEEGAP